MASQWRSNITYCVSVSLICMEIYALALLNGIALGSLLFLIASGLSLVLGAMGILNLAHGALYMVGAFVGWTILVKLGLNFWFAVLSGGLAASLIGLILHLGFLRHLHKQFNEQVLLTIGFLYILTNLGLWIWGGYPKPPFTAPFLRGAFPIMGRLFPTARIGIILFGVAIFIVLWWLQEKTRTGAIVRAGMDDKEMTEGIGINYGVVSVVVLCFGAFLAGIAGVLGANLMGAYLDLSTDVLLLGLAVVVIGGTGSAQGAILGGMLIGLSDAYSKLLVPEFAMFAPYIAMIIILLARPSGLTGRKAES